LDAAKLLQHERDIQFLIYGSGSEERHLRERVQKEGLDNVKMKGRVEKSHIPFILSSSSINLLNYSQTQYNWSRGNSSNKLFEYMASGTPIISTVKMGYCLLERYNCGISIEHSTPEELANAIVRVKNMPAREYETMSQNAREGAKDFDFEVLTRRLVKVIDAVMR
ncbi:MAG TPA: glycosyltransferase WbuB, partial [Firmicutes bacterium]|nr:glycosyltransferase WbuB [Bacillota bacterium]